MQPWMPLWVSFIKPCKHFLVGPTRVRIDLFSGSDDPACIA
jgi:hypothetical protein